MIVIMFHGIIGRNHSRVSNGQKIYDLDSHMSELTVGVDWRGFEPLTPRVQGEYSTAELPAHYRN